MAPQVSAEAIAAWRSGAYWALHHALGLHPWQMPDWNADPPGVDDRPDNLRQRYPVPDVAALKAALIAAAGKPPRRWRW
jgi:hypothetical protein